MAGSPARIALYATVAVFALAVLLVVQPRTVSAVAPVIDPTSCNGEAAPNAYCSFENAGDPQDIVIGPNSCNEVGACLNLGDGATINAAGDPLDDGSCNGTEACLSLGASEGSNPGSAQVGNQSCLGDSACEEAGLGGQASIGDGSCHSLSGDNTCRLLGSADGASPGFAQVGNGSCLGESACDQAGKAGGSFIVLDMSCHSLPDDPSNVNDACSRSGSGDGSSSTVGNRSCLGYEACYQSGLAYDDAPGSGAIGDDSCIGNSACWSNGYGGTGIVGDRSCKADGVGDQDACRLNGDRGDGRIGDDSCNAHRACRANGHNFGGTTGTGSIGNESCNGVSACENNGQGLEPPGASIGLYSCNNSDAAAPCFGNQTAIGDCEFNDPELSQCQDTDADEVPDADDNCATVPNPDQADADNDTVGNACDPCTDTDADGVGDGGFTNTDCVVSNGPDNCPDVPNPDQTDTDNDQLGDACDSLASGTLEVRKLVSWFDSGRFDLLIDGETYASAIGFGGSTGEIEVEVGTHTVSEAGANGTDLSKYVALIVCWEGGFSGSVVAIGLGPSVTVDVGPGEEVDCTITNLKKRETSRFGWYGRR